MQNRRATPARLPRDSRWPLGLPAWGGPWGPLEGLLELSWVLLGRFSILLGLLSPLGASWIASWILSDASWTLEPTFLTYLGSC